MGSSGEQGRDGIRAIYSQRVHCVLLKGCTIIMFEQLRQLLTPQIEAQGLQAALSRLRQGFAATGDLALWQSAVWEDRDHPCPDRC